ncbi:AP2/ERF and B3 domain-containing transcription factor At1g50680-like [Cynara cardunculus var. scolymus]|uniref:AP2/ERF domain-containing protein n=1 Tax=Cynara cardunculus var. scolymus TaxID=59895 RepID=A0A103XRU1_CYNCS|nr:AP2/ERF and B3 domain-containing transcription factor At1g50680-like [Cynara cardunculus var. scolymus]KVH95728.1 AP2/ERF domain-containing protein [Cynara cardunculus var. scolymus]
MEEHLDSSSGSNLTQKMNLKVMDDYGYSQKYKGVVPQQNGNWGAQIYANNQRIWLGTFKYELDAAMAYDRASIKLRSADAPRNFSWTKLTLQEAKFQSHYSMETVLAMIKDGSYQAKFDDFQREKRGEEIDHNLSPGKESCGFSCRVLFQKELTPSDVGKLNRLVIPKKYAVGYFPPVPDESEGYANDEVNLSFYDPQKRLWKFRYCYWKSSQSFVFTRGWNQFVKEKKLKAKDKITFYYHENLEIPNMGFWVIDHLCLSTNNNGASLKLGEETNDNCSLVKEGEENLKDEKTNAETIQRSSVKTKGLKLFGVQIME